jgi:hypothetical protein
VAHPRIGWRRGQTIDPKSKRDQRHANGRTAARCRGRVARVAATVGRPADSWADARMQTLVPTLCWRALLHRADRSLVPPRTLWCLTPSYAVARQTGAGFGRRGEQLVAALKGIRPVGLGGRRRDDMPLSPGLVAFSFDDN